MTRRSCVRIVLSLWALTSACGSDPHEPVIGALELTISTTGHDFDPDGYSVTVDAGSPLVVPTNGTASIPDLAPGVHTVTLAGLAGNCALTTPAPLEVTVPGAAGAVVTVAITCTAIYTLAYRGESGLELTDAAGTVRRMLITGGDPLAWSPDGRVLAVTSFVDGLTRLWFASPDDGDGARRLWGESISSDHYAGVWSPDGRELLLETVVRSHTTTVDLARYPLDESYPPQGVFGVWWSFFGEGVPREQGLRGYTWPDWSPDGSQIVIHDLHQLFILSRDGATQRLLADGVQPDWSPDGNQVVYVASADGHATLRLINPDGSNDRPLTAPATDETVSDPAWSPDGSTVAFVRQGLAPDSSVTSVHGYLIDRDGANERQMAVLPIGGVHPTWSADGVHLAYSGGAGTYVVNVDGSGFHLVSTQPTHPAQWRP
jgi:dipeptidyl aminopeptidase/acylaminoacyl peptidase